MQTAHGQAEAAKGALILRDAAGANLLIGAAVSTSELENPKVAKLIGEQFSALTAENEFKPDSLQHVKGTFTFERADKLVAFAQQHGMKVIGHNLMWHQQSPPWMYEDESHKPLPREKALANLKEHIDGVLKHFHGKVVGWDVVNEAIADEGEYLRDTPAHRAIGDDFVVQAFKLAQAADPDVELYYNDYNIEMPYKRAKAVRLIKELKAAGCRVDGVGIQGHWLLKDADTKGIDEAMTEFESSGVKLMITELDVDVLPRKGAGADVSATEKQGLDPYKTGLPDDVQQQLAKRYGEIFATLMKHRASLTRVTFWGSHDGTSWLNSWPVRGRTNYPMLWDRQLQAKPAFQAVVDALQLKTP